MLSGNIEYKADANHPADKTHLAEKGHLYEWLSLVGLLVVSLFLRLAFLDRAPPGLRFDELVNVRMADHVYAGEWPIYFQEAWGHEPLYHYFHAAGMALLGKSVLGVRIASVLFGVLGTFTTYLVTRQLFGASVGFVAATLLTTSFWSLMYSRLGLRHISLPPWIGFSTYCFWRGLQTPCGKRMRGTLWFSLGGLCIGGMLYTYFASRVVPVIFLAFTAYLALFHRPFLKGRWVGLLLFFLLPALIVAPMVLYLRQHPELEQRLGQVGGELFVALQAGDLRTLFSTVIDTLRMFSLRGDPEWLYNISGRPVFDPVTAIAFYAGLLMSFYRWRDPKNAFILLWLLLGIAPAVLSWPPGSLGHTIAAQSVTFVFPALALVSLWRWSAHGVHAAAEKPRWVHWSGRVVPIIIVLLFTLSNEYDYFSRWPRFPQVRAEYQAPITAVARYLEKHTRSQSACVSAPYVDYWNPWSRMSFDLLSRRRDVRVRWFDGTQSILIPAEGEALFFLPDHISSPSELDAGLRSLLMVGSRPVEIGYKDQNGSTFDLYLWEDHEPLDRYLETHSSARVWASPEGRYVEGETERHRGALALPLDFGHRLSLLAYTYSQTQIARGETWRVTTYWRVLGAHSDALAIFVHVLDDANAVKAGWDGLYVSTESWQKGDVFIHVHGLEIPEELSPGAQRVELGVYSPVTLERLALYTGDGDETAPYDRALLSSLDTQ